MRTLSLTTLFCFILYGVCVAQTQTGSSTEPEATEAISLLSASQAAKARGEPISGSEWMVAAANPLAVFAGAQILSEGGTAADAMVAVQTTLGLVEPQSSGLGGGAFLVWYDAATGAVTTLDGRETAPLAVTPRLFQNDAGEPLGFWDAVVGGRSVGTPGTPALMEAAHRRWGKANWGRLFAYAISQAENGFRVSPRLAGQVARDAERLSVFPQTAAYFLPGGAPVAEGELLVNRPYAETLKRMADGGSQTFYTGQTGESIISAVRGAAGNPGVLSATDLAIYEVKERPAVCGAYRGHAVCGMGPPSSGGLTVAQILGIIEPYDLAALGPENPETWRLLGDASRLAFADRGRYMADSDFVPVPVEGLIEPGYLASRSGLLNTDSALDDVAPGKPEFDHALNWADDASIEFPSTSHISIVDGFGNALSMTTTIENGFGSRLMTSTGFLLNNELTDFSFRSHAGGVPIANRVEPGKRPRSSMAPTIILQDNKPVLVIGSPGGSRIIGYVAQSIIAHIDWSMDVQAAVSMPHAINRFGTFDLEEGTNAADLAPQLSEMGFEVNLRALTSGLHAISIGTELLGGADPRREGIALGN